MRRVRVLYLCAAALLALLVLARCQRYTLVVEGASLEFADGLPHAAAEVSGEGGEGAGPFTTGPEVALQPGSYKALVRYAASDGGSTARLVQTDAPGEDGLPGRVLAEAALDPAAGEAELRFTVGAPAGTVRLETDFSGRGRLAIQNVAVLSVFLQATDQLLLAALLAALAAVGWWLVLRRPLAPGEDLAARLRPLWPVLLTAAVGLAASWPMWFDYIPAGHDVNVHLVRLEGLAEGWRSGQFPVRVNPVAAGGAGYAIGAMYPDLFLWPFALLRVCGVSLVGCWQALLTCVNLATAAVMYACAARLLQNRTAGAVACILYTLAPYRVTDLYIRAAVGEAVAMVFFPLVALGLYETLRGDRRRWPLLAAGMAGILLSHLLSAVMAVLFCAVFALASGPGLAKQPARLPALLKAAGLTLALSAWFLGPMLSLYAGPLQLHNMAYDLESTALWPAQLLMPAQYGLPKGLPIEETQYVPGLLLMLCGAGLLAALLAGPAEARKTRAARIGAGCLALAALALLLCSRAFPWGTVQSAGVLGALATFIQFPWRFVAVATALLALCGGALMARLPAIRAPARAVGLVALAVLCLPQMSHLVTMQLRDKPVLYRADPYPAADAADLGTREYFYEGTDAEALMAAPLTVAADRGEVALSGYEKDGLNLRFEWRAEDATTLTLPLVWYPGYAAEDENGNALPTARGENGLLTLPAQGGGGAVSVRYTGLWWYRLCEAGSALAALGCAVWWAVRRRTTPG